MQPGQLTIGTLSAYLLRKVCDQTSLLTSLYIMVTVQGVRCLMMRPAYGLSRRWLTKTCKF